jgi:hypothetical protein
LRGPLGGRGVFCQIPGQHVFWRNPRSASRKPVLQRRSGGRGFRQGIQSLAKPSGVAKPWRGWTPGWGGNQLGIRLAPTEAGAGFCLTLSGYGWSVASTAQGCRLGLGLFTAFWKFAAGNPGLCCSCPFREKSRARFATGARWCQRRTKRGRTKSVASTAQGCRLGLGLYSLPSGNCRRQPWALLFLPFQGKGNGGSIPD